MTIKWIMYQFIYLTHIYYASDNCKEHVLDVRRDKRWEIEFSHKRGDSLGEKKFLPNIKIQVACIKKVGQIRCSGCVEEGKTISLGVVGEECHQDHRGKATTLEWDLEYLLGLSTLRFYQFSQIINMQLFIALHSVRC